MAREGAIGGSRALTPIGQERASARGGFVVAQYRMDSADLEVRLQQVR